MNNSNGIQRHEIEAWLGPAYGVLTEAQIDRVHREAVRIHERYPDPDDSEERDAALSAYFPDAGERGLHCSFWMQRIAAPSEVKTS